MFWVFFVVFEFSFCFRLMMQNKSIEKHFACICYREAPTPLKETYHLNQK